MRKELFLWFFFRLDKVRGLYAYVSPMCNGEIRTYVVLPKRGESLFLLILCIFRSVSSSLLNAGDYETNTSLKKGFETDKAGRGQKDLMSCVDFNS